MDMLYEANVSATPPALGTQKGYPSDGDLATATPATIPGAGWFHSVTKELIEVIEGAGLEPDGATLNQVFLAIEAIATTIATGLANTAQANAITAAEADAATLATAAQTNAENAVLSWFTTGQTLGTTIVQPLPGGLILQIGSYTAAVSDTAYTVTLPESFPSAHLFAFASVNWSGNVSGSWSAYATPGDRSTVILTGDVSSGSASNIPLVYLCLGK